MKILVIGDIHGRRFWKTAVEKNINKVDKIVFLGDYFDVYTDEGIEYEWDATLANFNEILELKRANPDKVVLLLGNHDMHYRDINFDEYTRSTRFDKVHENRLRHLFNDENRALFQTCYITEVGKKKVIFSHAGITKYWLDKCELKLDDSLEANINDLENNIKGIGKLCIIGKERTWFGDKTGSIMWCDVSEFLEDEGLGDDYFQIFGHTRLKKGVMIKSKTFACVDSQVAFILNDKCDLKEV